MRTVEGNSTKHLVSPDSSNFGWYLKRSQKCSDNLLQRNLYIFKYQSTACMSIMRGDPSPNFMEVVAYYFRHCREFFLSFAKIECWNFLSFAKIKCWKNLSFAKIECWQMTRRLLGPAAWAKGLRNDLESVSENVKMWENMKMSQTQNYHERQILLYITLQSTNVWI